MPSSATRTPLPPVIEPDAIPDTTPPEAGRLVKPAPSPKRVVAVTDAIPDIFVELSPIIFPFALIFAFASMFAAKVDTPAVTFIPFLAVISPTESILVTSS